jgi:uncharacterized protein (DUF2249 family)
VERVAQKLVQKGASLNAITDHYETPLMKAVEHGFESSQLLH